MVKLLSKQKIYSDGKHNAFTDLLYFKGKYYLSFRSGTSHISDDSRLVICSSKDLENWNLKEIFSEDDKDVRDTKLFIFKNKLFCLFPIRHVNQFYNVSYVIYSEDGENWSEPKICEKTFWGIWRPRIYKGKIYGGFYYYDCKDIRNENLWKVALLSSSDGFKFRYISTIFDGDAANETEIEFIGRNLIAVVRREGKSTILAKSKAPYKEWDYVNLKRQLHSPCIQKVNKKFIMAVREFELLERIERLEVADYVIEKRKQKEKVSLWEWNGKTFEENLVLEEGKNIDSGYSGIEVDRNDKSCALISYYLGYPRCADIWLAKVEIK